MRSARILLVGVIGILCGAITRLCKEHHVGQLHCLRPRNMHLLIAW